jgi:dimethylargininase
MSSFRLRSLSAALIAAAVTAIVALAAALLLAYVASTAASMAGSAQSIAPYLVFGPYLGYFAGGTVFLFVFLAILGLVGTYRHWYTALIAGIVSAVLGALLGTALQALGQGVPLDGAFIGELLATLGGINLIFVLAGIIAAITLGRRIYSALSLTEEEEVLRGRHVLVRRPAVTLADGIVTYVERSDVDVALAEEQWEAYLAALMGAGWDPVEVTPADGLPDSVFIEDTVVMFGTLAVIGSPGAETRIGETTAVEESIRDLGLEITRIQLPGTLEGGDVLKIGTTVYVGKGDRTNSDGIRQLRKILAPRGYSVVAVPVSHALHLKSAVTGLPDGTVIGYLPAVDDAFVFDRFLEVPEPAGAHVVVLGDDTVLMAASAPESARLVEGLGYRVISVDISEFEKLEGNVTCLSVRIR